MSDAEPPRWLQGVAIGQATSTLYAALGATCGAILDLVAPYFNGNPWGWFFAGMAIPPGPLYLVYTSDWMFERRLRRLKRWRNEDLMPPRMYDESLKRSIAWRDERLYGKPVGSIRTTSARPRVARPLPAPSPEPNEETDPFPSLDPNSD